MPRLSAAQRRLADVAAQLPGWKVWTCHPSTRPWNAVPAPAGTGIAAAVRLPGRIQANNPATLIALCSERYGWNDYCDTCGLRARYCGHRQPESKE